MVNVEVAVTPTQIKPFAKGIIPQVIYQEGLWA